MYSFPNLQKFWTKIHNELDYVVDIDAQAARNSTASDIWWIGVRRLAVVNGPNIFQMLFVLKILEAT